MKINNLNYPLGINWLIKSVIQENKKKYHTNLGSDLNSQTFKKETLVFRKYIPLFIFLGGKKSAFLIPLC